MQDDTYVRTLIHSSNYLDMYQTVALPRHLLRLLGLCFSGMLFQEVKWLNLLGLCFSSKKLNDRILPTPERRLFLGEAVHVGGDVPTAAVRQLCDKDPNSGGPSPSRQKANPTWSTRNCASMGIGLGRQGMVLKHRNRLH